MCIKRKHGDSPAAQCSSQKHLKMSVSSHFICLFPVYKLIAIRNLTWCTFIYTCTSFPFVLSTIPALSSITIYFLWRNTSLRCTVGASPNCLSYGQQKTLASFVWLMHVPLKKEMNLENYSTVSVFWTTTRPYYWLKLCVVLTLPLTQEHIQLP